CITGKLSCATGPTCEVSGNAQNGTSCGTDKVCAIGLCVDCKQGDTCTPADTCRTGTWACAAGPVCNPTGNKAAGTECDTGKVCDSAAKCVACVADGACEPTNECHQGKQECANGPNCVDTELPATDGTSCAGSAPFNFCASGVCAACQNGASCVPSANPCHKGTLNCATNPPTCNEQQANVVDGLVCGDNKSCISGACVTNNRVLTVTSGAVADVAVNAPFANVSVKLVDANNTPLQGVAITVVPAAGAYAVAGNTGATGISQVSGRVGRAVGSYKFTVSAPGASSVEFTAKAVAPNAKDIFTLVNANKLPSGGATVPGAGSVSKLSTEARAVASASDGTLYIASHCAVYKLTPAGVLTRIAGQGTASGDSCSSTTGSSGAGTSVQFNYVYGLALDEPRGYLYIADYYNYRVWQLDLATGSILTFAGDKNAANVNPWGDGGPADSAYITPSGVSVAPNGDVYISDYGTGRLRKVDSVTGIITSVFIPSTTCSSTGPLQFARCYDYGNACSVAWDKDGKMFLSAYLCGDGEASSFNGVARVEADKSLVRLAGGYGTESPAEGGTATSAKFTYAPAIAFDKAGNLYLANRGGDRVHRVDALTTRITTIAGTGTAGFTGDYVAGNTAQVNKPTTLAFDDAGNLYFADATNLAVRAIWGVGTSTAPTGTLAKVAGTGQTVKLDAPFAPITVKLTDSANANISGVNVRWKRSETATGSGLAGGAIALTSTTNASGNATQTGRVGLAPGNYTFEASYNDIHGVPVTGSPQVFSIAAEAPASGIVFPLMNYVHVSTGGTTGVPGPAAFAKPNSYALGVAAAADGTMYVADTCAVYKISPRGEISLFAGGTCGFSGDSGPAAGAKVSNVYALALDETRGYLYIADYSNARVRMVSLSTGNIDTLAGGGSVNAEPYGDNGQGADANIGNPSSVSVDANGLVYVPDYNHNRIRVINPETGIVTTWLMGNTAACVQGTVRLRYVPQFNAIVRFKADGDAYIAADFCQGATTNATQAIVLRAKATGALTRIAGLYQGATTEGADAAASLLPDLSDFDIEADGNLVLAMYTNHRIRRINMATGKINTLIGDGTVGYAGAGDVSSEPGAYVPATSARVNHAWKIAAVPGGHVLFSDWYNATVRMIW
ncbi:MAG: repeat containing protein, partial [Polyangiaceae bacterium]|nr:repeat containing protein [Polyangiaceae bacterium]